MIRPPRATTTAYANAAGHLADELALLDLLLELELTRRRIRGGDRQEGPLDSLRGLVVSSDEVEDLLAKGRAESRECGATAELEERIEALATSVEARRRASAEAGVVLPLPELSRRFALSQFEEHCLLLCLAPEVDRRYDRLFAYLQDDVSRKRPTIGLALDLFATDRIVARQTLTAGAPLRRFCLLDVTDVGGTDGPQPLIARSLILDDRISGFLLDDPQPDPVLGAAVRIEDPRPFPSSPPAPEDRERQARRLASAVSTGELEGRRHLILHATGPRGSGRRALAAAVADELKSSLLTVDLSLLPIRPGSRSLEEMLERIAREAFLQSSVLLIEGFDHLLAPTDGSEATAAVDRSFAEREPSARRLRAILMRSLETLSRVTVLVGRKEWRPSRRPQGALLVSLRLLRPRAIERASLWHSRQATCPNIAAAVAAAGGEGVLASSLRFTAGQIDDTLADAADLAWWRRGPEAEIGRDELNDAARRQSSPELGRLARRLEHRIGWDRLVLPSETRQQLVELCDQARYRHRVLDDWGYGARFPNGKGLAALFSGPPGTGKTLTASIIATELGIDLHRIDLSQIVSKYIGETEKNLDRIFCAAEHASVILFFDEADALFGKRSEVRDSHDRYANVEVSYLLQKMEDHEGVAILATNLRQHLDEAFMRRLTFVIEFPFPNAGDRRRIWEVSMPASAPVHDGVDLSELAREVRLAGGNIKNISLAAAYFAAADGGVIRMDHLWLAARREFAKLGRDWSIPKLTTATAAGGQA